MNYLKILSASIMILSFIVFLPYASAEDEVLGIDIKTYLNNIRKQFIELRKTKEKDELPMFIEKIHVELNVIAKIEGEGGVKFYVLSVGGKFSKELTQKLSFDVYLGGKPGTGTLVYMPPQYVPFGDYQEWATKWPKMPHRARKAPINP